MAQRTCICVRVPQMQRWILEFWADIRPSKWHIFPGCSSLFQLVSARPWSALQQCSLIDTECVCFAGLLAVQVCLLLKMYDTSCIKESDTLTTMELPKPCIQQEWPQTPHAKVQQLISSVQNYWTCNQMTGWFNTMLSWKKKERMVASNSW